MLWIWAATVEVVDFAVPTVDFAVPALLQDDPSIKKRRERFVRATSLAIVAALLGCIITFLRDVEVVESLRSILWVPAHVIGQMRIEGQGKLLASTFVPVHLVDAVAGLFGTVAGLLPDPESVGMVFIGAAWKCFQAQLIGFFGLAAVIYYFNACVAGAACM